MFGRDTEFSFDTFEIIHILPSCKLVPDTAAFHWMPPTHKGIPLTKVWTLTQNIFLCFKNISETGKTGLPPTKHL